MLLNVRMVQQIAQWDDEVHAQMASNISGKFEEEPDDPLPMLIL